LELKLIMGTDYLQATKLTKYQQTNLNFF